MKQDYRRCLARSGSIPQAQANAADRAVVAGIERFQSDARLVRRKEPQSESGHPTTTKAATHAKIIAIPFFRCRDFLKYGMRTTLGCGGAAKDRLIEVEQGLGPRRRCRGRIVPAGMRVQYQHRLGRVIPADPS